MRKVTAVIYYDYMAGEGERDGGRERQIEKERESMKCKKEKKIINFHIWLSFKKKKNMNHGIV